MRDRPANSELLAWTLVGVGAGLVLGALLTAWLGPALPTPRRKTGTAADDPGKTAGRLKVSEMAEAVRAALAQDPLLRPLDLTPLPVSPGIVELHGWVPERQFRARAARLAARVPGISTVVNCLLVHGEDDFPTARLAVTDQPA